MSNKEKRRGGSDAERGAECIVLRIDEANKCQRSRDRDRGLGDSPVIMSSAGPHSLNGESNSYSPTSQMKRPTRKLNEGSQCLCSPDFCNLMATLLFMRRDSATWRLGDGRNTAAFGKEDQGWDQE